MNTYILTISLFIGFWPLYYNSQLYFKLILFVSYIDIFYTLKPLIYLTL